MTKHRTLRDALIGETVTVGKLAGEGPVRRRIMDMGVTKGTQIFIRKVAPLGDPIFQNFRETLIYYFIFTGSGRHGPGGYPYLFLGMDCGRSTNNRPQLERFLQLHFRQ